MAPIEKQALSEIRGLVIDLSTIKGKSVGSKDTWLLEKMFCLTFDDESKFNIFSSDGWGVKEIQRRISKIKTYYY